MTGTQQKIKHIGMKRKGRERQPENKAIYLGVIGSFIYAFMLDTGSSNGPSTKVSFNLPSYSNLLNMSCRKFCLIIKTKRERLQGQKTQRNTNTRAMPAMMRHCLDQMVEHQIQFLLGIWA